jgi:hypothetical protein
MKTSKNLRITAGALDEKQTEHKLQKWEWKQSDKTNLLRVHIFQKSDQDNNRYVREHHHQTINNKLHGL